MCAEKVRRPITDTPVSLEQIRDWMLAFARIVNDEHIETKAIHIIQILGGMIEQFEVPRGFTDPIIDDLCKKGKEMRLGEIFRFRMAVKLSKYASLERRHFLIEPGCRHADVRDVVAMLDSLSLFPNEEQLRLLLIRTESGGKEEVLAFVKNHRPERLAEITKQLEFVKDDLPF